MAQYTPNFNLYKPDTSDDFADFRAEHNNNMDIIDANLGGGGGSGGHTIIDENGQSMTQRTGLEFTGNVQVTDDSVNDKTIVDILGGGGNVYGAFVNTSNLIYSGTYSLNLSYTATEDCFIWLALPLSPSTSGKANIDGVQVSTFWNGTGSVITDSKAFYLKKGQILTATATNSSSASYYVYGLTQGTNGIYAPVIYSDNERVIGVWRDNKPLYAKTINFGSLPANNSSKTVAHGISDIETLANAVFTVQSSAQFRTLPNVSRGNVANQTVWYMTATDIGVLTGSNADVGSAYSGYVTIWYTKTTDVAGSGNWNTDGVPTHHYSTSEQVIGTWLGKPLYQRVWDFGSDLVIPNNSFYTTNIDASVIETIVEGFGIYPTGATRYNLMTNTNGVNIRLQADRTNGSANVRYFVMSYTKTTDT